MTKRIFGGLILVLAIGLCQSGAAQAPSNSITLRNDGSSEIKSHAMSISRAFARGEIKECVVAGDGSTRFNTQADVKNRWPDGSYKFAIITFLVPDVAPKQELTVSFEADTCPAERSKPATAEDLLASNVDFDAVITANFSGSNAKISARSLLEKGKVRSWLSGPLVSAFIIEDLDPERRSDVGPEGAHLLHPIFEVWFYPGDSRYEVGYTLENAWASSQKELSARDAKYSFSLSIGDKSPRIVYSNPVFNHAAFTRWHKTFTSSNLEDLIVNHNSKYLVTTGAFPRWDADLVISPLLIRKTYDKWQSANHNIGGEEGNLGNYNSALNGSGAADWIGLATTWDVIYFLTSSRSLKQVSYGNADLAGGMPYHFREADVSAGSGKFFDRPIKGSTPTFGAIVSINAREQVTLGDLADDCSHTITSDLIRTSSKQPHDWPTDLSHIPDVAYLPYLLSGRYYYLSELQYHAGYMLGAKLGCTGGTFARQGSLGLLNESQVRGEAWGIRTVSYAAFISVDGSPEKNYFDDKLRNNIAELEGIHGLALGEKDRAAAYEWGRDKSFASQAVVHSPLYSWQDRGSEFIQPPLRNDGYLSGAASPWEEGFLTCSLGLAKQFGYPTTPLLRFMAHRVFNTLLNPEIGHPQLIEAYRYPTKLANGKWVSTWREFVNAYDPLPTNWQKGGNIDHSYGFIAMSALSYLYDLEVDGYSGKDAWDYMRAKKPERGRLATESPKWSIKPW